VEASVKWALGPCLTGSHCGDVKVGQCRVGACNVHRCRAGVKGFETELEDQDKLGSCWTYGTYRVLGGGSVVS
jgi:hypothetical protein